MGSSRIRIAALVTIAAAAALAAPASAVASCRPGHDVLARARGHAVVWATLTRNRHGARDRVYVCVSRYGGAHVVYTEAGNAHPRVTHLRLAGHFVGFFLATEAPYYVGSLQSSRASTTLYVFDAAQRRVDMRDEVSCESSVCASAPVMSKYFLTPSGWVAELYEVTDTNSQTITSNLRELVASYAPAATRNTRESVPLDLGLTISHVSLSGPIASWTDDLSGASSALLGSGLVPSRSPQATGACQLLTATDVSPVLGQASSSQSPSECRFSSESNPSKTLSLSFKSGLSSQQVDADASALQNNSSFFPIILYDGGYSIYVGTVTISGVTHEQLGFFAPSNGSECSLDLAAPGADADEQLAWLANVAFDRLFALPVSRTN